MARKRLLECRYYKLVSRGYWLVHSSVVNLPMGGVLTTGFPNSGKTLTMVTLAKVFDKDAIMLNDDLNIIDRKGYAYGSPPQRLVYTLLLNQF